MTAGFRDGDVVSWEGSSRMLRGTVRVGDDGAMTVEAEGGGRFSMEVFKGSPSFGLHKDKKE